MPLSRFPSVSFTLLVIATTLGQSACSGGGDHGSTGLDPTHPGSSDASTDRHVDGAASTPDAVATDDGSRASDGGADGALADDATGDGEVRESAAMDDDADSEPPECLADGGGPVTRDVLSPPSSFAGACGAALHLGASTLVIGGETSDDGGMTRGKGIRFAGMTPDELSIAWFEDGTLNYADRASRSDHFGPAGSLDNVPVVGQVAWSADGLRVVVAMQSQHGFVEYARIDRAHRFTTSSDTQFTRINALGLMLGSNESLGYPVLAADNHALFFLRSDGESHRHDAVYMSTRASDVAWPLGVAVHATDLDAVCGRFRRPTGLSADTLTLFYWDDMTGSERATFRATADSPFTGSIDIGAFADAAPNAGCTSLYTTSSSGGVSAATLAP